MTVTFLGSGTSHGVPVIGCNCRTCTSTDSHDARYRSSIVIRINQKVLLVDTGPEFRLQAIRDHITHIDAVLYTHDHADHLNGIDDLRVFTHGTSLDIYGNKRLIDTITNRFAYVLGHCEFAGGLPHLIAHEEAGGVPFDAAGIEVLPVPIHHGDRMIFGYRIGSFAYLTDCSGIDESSYEMLHGLDTLVIGALRRNVHPTHFSIGQALDAAQRIGARTTYLTHLSHENLHQELEESLPPSVHVAYDTLCLEIPGPQEGATDVR